MSENGVAVADKLGQTTVNIDDLAGQTVRLEVPGRVEGVPPVKAKVPRRVDLPDGEHYLMVLGGGSNLERMWLNAVDRRIRQMADEDVDPLQSEMWAMSQWATFVADRVIEHNLEYAPGDPLPTGLDLVWELGYRDTRSMIWAIISRPRFFADPKAEATSSTSSSDGDSSP